MDALAQVHLPPSWSEAIAEAGTRRRVLVLGGTDMGKSAFIRTFLESPDEAARLIDLDPGQKMLGPPGAATLGTAERLARFIFLGSTSASNIGGIARAAAALAEAAEPFIVNTAGFVHGLGARLQALTVASVRPDLIVEIGDPATPPIVAAPNVPLVRLERSPMARTKSPAARAANRQAAFERALGGGSSLRLREAHVHPAPPALAFAPAKGALPVCALADADGRDMCIGVLQAHDEESAVVHAIEPPRPIALIRLGKMWAAPGGKRAWRLLEKLSPAWSA